MRERPTVTRRQLWQAFALCLLTWLPLVLLDTPLRNESLPLGILSFELLATAERARAALGSWDDTARACALWSLILDYAFMFGYAWWLSRLAWYGGAKMRERSAIVARWAVWAAGAAWFAAACDAVENGALFVVLLDTPEQPWPAIATTMAAIKFMSLNASLFYGLTAVLAALMPQQELPVRVSGPRSSTGGQGGEE